MNSELGCTTLSMFLRSVGLNIPTTRCFCTAVSWCVPSGEEPNVSPEVDAFRDPSGHAEKWHEGEQKKYERNETKLFYYDSIVYLLYCMQLNCVTVHRFRRVSPRLAAFRFPCPTPPGPLQPYTSPSDPNISQAGE